MYSSIVIIALCALFQAGSAEYCYSCFTATIHSSFTDQEQWGENASLATSWPEYASCYHPEAFEPVECWTGSGCERLNAEVEFYLDGEWGTFQVLYLGCGNSSAVVNGCTFEPDEILDYLLPFKTSVDGEFGQSLDWRSVIYGQACRCSGDFCNSASYVKMSYSLLIVLSLITVYWNRM